VLGKLQNKEEFATLVNKLLSRLSKFEKQVFFLYAQQYTYEEISDIINRKFPQRSDVNVKGVDNALSRIKNKAKVIAKRHDARAAKAGENAPPIPQKELLTTTVNLSNRIQKTQRISLMKTECIYGEGL
jgi:hypothetical protein